MAEVHRFGGDFFAALDQYVQASADTAHVAHAEGMSTLQRDLQKRADRHPRWKGLSAHIEIYDEVGQARVGIRNPDVVGQAVSAEYGDADHPPAPLFRITRHSAQKAGERMGEVLRTHLGAS